MTGWKNPWTRPTLVLVTVAVTLCSPMQTLAADPVSNWRPIYDTVMMWVNFIILMALLIKFLRQPLRDFLNKQRDAVQHTMDRLGSEKNRIEKEIQSLRATLEGRKQKAEDMHRRIVAQGENERRDIIATARQEAERRLTKAHQLIEARHREACQALRNEIVDTAIHLAMQEFGKHMTPDMEQTLTDRFLETAAGRQP